LTHIDDGYFRRIVI